MGEPQKLDLFKQHKAEYAARRTPCLVNVAPACYLAIDGQGAPGGEAFQEGIGAMYAMAFTIKMASKFAGRDYKVCTLEGLWWGPEGVAFADLPREQWRWKLLIRTPEFIGADDLAKARQSLRDKGKAPRSDEVVLERINEGTCVQMLHVGPYAAEGESIEAMLKFAAEGGLSLHGRHHEIYLSDPRRVQPERLRTILRHAVVRA